MHQFYVAMFLTLAKRTQSFSPFLSSSGALSLARGGVPSIFHNLHTQKQQQQHIQTTFQLDSSSLPSLKRRYLSSSFSSSTRPTPTTAMNTSTQQEQEQIITSMYGGDYAGQSATFSPSTGKLIPVPEHYVPESMIEWGQVPSSLEVIVSEDLIHDEKTGTTSTTGSSSEENSLSLSRSTIQVMPEVGCGLDNLDTMKLKEDIPLNLEGGSSGDIELDGGVHKVASATTYIQTKTKHRVECIFTTAKTTTILENGDTDTDTDIDTDTNAIDSSHHQISRIRIGVNFFPNKMELRSPIEIIKERKTSNTSSKGTIADGGGLDARTVTKLVGKDNSNRPFCEKNDEMDLETIMAGSWNVIASNNGNGNNDGGNIVTVVDRDSRQYCTKNSNSSANDKDTLTTTLSLPGNVIIQYGGSPFTLEISFIVNQQDGDNDSDDNNKGDQPIRRLVMKREFYKNNSDASSSNNFTSSVNYFWEEKIVKKEE